MADDVQEQRENNGGVTGKGFMPGQSGNPGGRPKGRSLTAILRERLEQQALDRKGAPIEGKTVADVVIDALLGEAAAGDVKAIKELLDRVEGKTRVLEPESKGAEARDAWQALHDEIHDA